MIQRGEIKQKKNKVRELKYCKMKLTRHINKSLSKKMSWNYRLKRLINAMI